MANGKLLAVLIGFWTSLSLNAAEHGYPAFSPDGQWLVFSSDDHGTHDLYRADREGSNITRLTSRTGTETQPTWSPDGKRIAYVYRPWNPSSRSMLYVIDPDGENAQRIGDIEGIHLPHWGEDGRIYFSMRVDAHNDIFSVQANGTDLVNHTRSPEIDETNADLKSGILVYDRPYGDDYAIETLDLKSGRRTLVLTDGVYWDPQWSAKGDGLLVGVYADGSGMSRLTGFDGSGNPTRAWSPADRNVFWPTVSPDGGSVVFSYSDTDYGVGELYSLDLETGAIRRFLHSRNP